MGGSFAAEALWGAAAGAVVAVGLLAVSFAGGARSAGKGALALAGLAGTAVSCAIVGEIVLPASALWSVPVFNGLMGAAPVLFVAAWLRVLVGSWRRHREPLLGFTVGSLMLVPVCLVPSGVMWMVLGGAPGFVLAAFSAGGIAVQVKRWFAHPCVGGAVGFAVGLSVGLVLLVPAVLASVGLVGGLLALFQGDLPGLVI